jgi:hypothetical protein
VLTALNHKQPDKMAVDFGATGCTSMHVSCIEQLREYFKLEKSPVKVMDLFTMAGIIEDDLMDILGTDAAIAMARGTRFGFPGDRLKLWKAPHGQEVLVPEDFVATDDGKGGLYVHPLGDPSLPPSGHMPQGSYYFDAVMRGGAVDDDEIKPEDNLEEYTILSNEDLVYLKESTQKARKTGRAVVYALPGLALGDAAEIPGCGLAYPKGVRNVEEWYMSPLIRPEYVAEMFDKQMDIAIENMKLINDMCGDEIDVVLTCGADLAHQKSTFFSKEVFEELYVPYYKKANDWIHTNTNWKIMKHNCGAIEPFIPKLIEVGFDILNPVQCSADGMDAVHLKKEYGQEITFWGGCVDTQHVLPFGTPEEVRAQVLERCEIFAPGGGYVCNAIHDVQAGTPLENMLAMINAIKEFNGDPKV